MKRGVFIAVEGADCAGKSTQVRHLVARLAAAGAPFYVTAEPTRGPVGTVIRNMLTGYCDRPTDPLAFQTLYVADRREHVATVIEPALASGCSVVCDRYHVSTMAYAVAAGDDVRRDGSRLARLGDVRAMHHGILLPDVTVVLDVPDELAAARLRAKHRADVHERDAAMQARVRDAYRHIVENGLAGPAVLISGEGDAASVAERVWEAVAPHVPT